ncbi:hypothetical protein ACJJTC_008990, partial [Scirpophaga incertulas]
KFQVVPADPAPGRPSCKQARFQADSVPSRPGSRQIRCRVGPVRGSSGSVRGSTGSARGSTGSVRGSTGSRQHRFGSGAAPVHGRTDSCTSLYHCGTMYTSRNFFLVYSPRFEVDPTQYGGRAGAPPLPRSAV